MADPARFPQLVLPFALTGGAAGWLSASFLSNPLIRLLPSGLETVSACLATAFAAATGALLTRWCAGRRYAYELEATDPEARLSTDTWPRHVSAVLIAGALTGAVLPALHYDYRAMPVCALSGALCGLAFLPVCVAVINAARRAQRARLGSMVAGSDRRAVWGYLAVLLAVATQAGLLGWPAAGMGYDLDPRPALWMVQAAGLLTLALLAADLRALRRARLALAPGLEPQGEGPTDETVPRLDLGLGDEVLARLARSASAYRARDRTLALVQGDTRRAEEALRRAVRRGVLGTMAIGAVYGAHLVAGSSSMLARFRAHECDVGAIPACQMAARLVERDQPAQAIALYERGCRSSVAADCKSVGQLYERGEGLPADLDKAVSFYDEACEAGDAASCRRTAELMVGTNVPILGNRSAVGLLRRGCALGDAASCPTGW